MAFTTFKRILRSGFIGFKRNGWLSTATVMIVTIVLFILGSLVLIGALGSTILASLESKIDISVYFVPDADEPTVLAVKQEIEARPEIAEVSYVSKEQALQRFEDRHRDNVLIRDALAELEENPLVASLNVRAHDSAKYAAISEFLSSQNYPKVEKINYSENELVINRLSAAIGMVRVSGVFVALFFAFIAVLVAFNTIRLAIYTLREEVHIMRLVGATRWFIRGPFLVAGILYGVIASSVAMLIFFPLTWGVAPKLTVYVPEFNVFDYFVAHFWSLYFVLLFVGVLIGTFSSTIAIRRYLEA